MGYVFLCSMLLKNEVKVFLECIYINQTTWNVCFLYQFLRAKLMLFDGALHLAALISTTLTECVLQDCIHTVYKK